jgi:RHH-type proline utilization regulon transcriptional repressor/proline dehydrogenase/delta 1-pyrroline-5-carboxylate dehydrogenase
VLLEPFITEDWARLTPDQIFARIADAFVADEQVLVSKLVQLMQNTRSRPSDVARHTETLVNSVRQQAIRHPLDRLLQEYSLDSEEGLVLMCLAEALLRIPDRVTADAFIRDRLGKGDFAAHLKPDNGFFVNSATRGLILGAWVTASGNEWPPEPVSVFQGLIKRLGTPVVRLLMRQTMKLMGQQFVMGENLSAAYRYSSRWRDKGCVCSFDMLGEAALTEEDAERYAAGYLSAIETLGAVENTNLSAPVSISIKLSALHPRYEQNQASAVFEALNPRVMRLLERARMLGVPVTIDAEEQSRLELSLELFRHWYGACKGWGGLGLAVQTYGKRALPVLQWLASLVSRQGDPISVRLVKGAYWDSEIKWAQQLGIEGYPVFTRKANTDLSYLACAGFLLRDDLKGLIFPQFATHNAHTIAAIIEMGGDKPYEFQRLHGMGEALYDVVMAQTGRTVRIYAPVGHYRDLLPYLVRRLLENGANNAFVHRLLDVRCPVAELSSHPLTQLSGVEHYAHPDIPLPVDMLPGRQVARGLQMQAGSHRQRLGGAVSPFMEVEWQAGPIVGGDALGAGPVQTIFSPADRREKVGSVAWADAALIDEALSRAHAAFGSWSARTVPERSACLEKMADLLEVHAGTLTALCHREAGKTVQDSIDEIREAVDFCRYYALEARQQLSRPGRGVFVCISPWNFPLAIFVGQVAAALVAGNTVVAKPAEQTPIIAWRAVQLFHDAGVPGEVLHLLPGGPEVGEGLTRDCRVAGVAFTGSHATAVAINRSLSCRLVAPVPLIAETGGLNAMIADSTALPEQLVVDVVHSAFVSAGQRCSALRVLFLQEEIAEPVVTLIKGAMAELRLGLPHLLSTDVGPVIDEKALADLQAHIERMGREGRIIARAPLPADLENGIFLAPVACEIDSIAELDHEPFGPVLHVIRYEAEALDRVIDQINGTGYGLTLGIHSRNESTVAHIERRARVGNIYVNRHQVGAVVGVQPFGGRGLSGTGPKAGGPFYLSRFVSDMPVGRKYVKESGLSPASIASGTGEGRAEARRLLALAAARFEAWSESGLPARVMKMRHLHESVATMPAFSGEKSRRALERFRGLVDLAERYLAPRTLPGPVGESNRFYTTGRGVFACLVPGDALDIEILAGQLGSLLVAGNIVVVQGLSGTGRQWLETLVEKLGVTALLVAGPTLGVADILSAKGLDGVSLVGPVSYQVAVQQILAQRPGPVIPLVADDVELDQMGDPARLYRLVAEKTCTLNCSAVGGNASLLTQSGDA